MFLRTSMLLSNFPSINCHLGIRTQGSLTNGMFKQREYGIVVIRLLVICTHMYHLVIDTGDMSCLSTQQREHRNNSYEDICVFLC